MDMDRPKDETSGLVCLHTNLIMALFFLITAKSKGFNPSLFLIDKFSSLPNLPKSRVFERMRCKQLAIFFQNP